MSKELTSILVLIAVFLIATTRGNMGVLGIVAAFAVGTALGVSEDDIFAGFPGDLFVILVGVTFLFAIASSNGTVDWLVYRAVKAVGGRTAAIVDVGFVALSIAAVLSLISPASAKGAVGKIAWPTVLLICGVVMYVGLLENIGTIDWLGEQVATINAALVAAL